MKKYRITWILTVLLTVSLLVGVLPASAAQVRQKPDVPSWAVGKMADDERVTIIVELEDAPIVELGDLTDLRPEIPPGMEEEGEWADTLAVENYRAQLMEEQATVFSEMDEQGINYQVGFQYDTLLNGFSCDIAYGDIAELFQIDGVANVYPVHYYDAPQAVYTAAFDEYQPQMLTCNPTTGNSDMVSSGYRGEGMVVAVLDTGYRLDHPAFTESGNPYLGSAALSSTSSAITSLTSLRGKYYNKKIPFTCNYYNILNGGSNKTITYGNGHGTHVAGIVGGYDPDFPFQGAAPAAQILGMQVFADNGGTNSSVYVKALEDSLTLGADVVNMSLGSDCGFSVGSYNGVPTDEEKVFNRLRDAGVVVCISAGNSGSYMAPYSFHGDGTSQPYYDSKKDSFPGIPDYATVSNPSTLCSNISVASANTSTDSKYGYRSSDGRPQISDFSSRGPATTLDIRPTLTSIGGAVASANAARTNQSNDYVYKWGTSMSAPNLSGTFANLLCYLKSPSGGNISNKVTRMETAIALMECSADLICGTGSNEVASVIQQGAGLGNSLNAMNAYQYGAYITNPIQELRDDPDKTGVYTMRLQLKNSSSNSVTYRPDTMVLTDKVLNGKNTQETTPVGANVTYSINNSAVTSVTVSAGGTVWVDVTISLTGPAENSLDEDFPNGAYIQGFVTFTPLSGSASPVHATYLAFYGDWSQVDCIEKFYMADGEDADVLHDNSYIYIDFNDFKSGKDWTGKNMIPLGENPMDFWDENGTGYGSVADYDVKRAAIPGGYKTDIGDTNILYNGIVVWPTALRNMRALSFSVTDPEGALTYRGGGGYSTRMIPKAHGLDDGTWPAASEFRWDGYSDGVGYENCAPGTWWLNSGVQAVLHVDIETPYSRDGVNYEIQHHDYPIMIDFEDPALDTSKVFFDPVRSTITLPASDNHYVAAVYIVDSSEKVTDCILFDEDEPGTTVIAPQLAIAPTAKVGDTIKVRVMDYASNWVEQDVTLTHTVFFDLQGHGEAIDPIYGIADNGRIAEPATEPQAEGYRFDGWFAADGTEFDFENTPITANTTIYAKWTQLLPVNFHFNGKGGSDKTEIVPSGSTVSQPEVSPVEGYTFEGWYSSSDLDGTAYDFDSAVTESMDLYANWVRNRYTVTFDMKDHGGAIDPVQVYHGDAASEPDPAPTTVGYTFKGWYTSSDLSGDPYDFTTPVTGGMTLYAKWELNRYTVTFDTKGRGEALESAQVYHGSAVAAPDPAPSAQNYRFDGWFADAECTQSYDFDTPVTGDMELFAKWTRLYTVNFRYGGRGGTDYSVQIASGSTVEAPSEPATVGYTFGGWYTDPDCSSISRFSFDSAVTSSLTLYAKWTAKTYTVTFHDNGFETGVRPLAAKYDSTIAEPSPGPTGDLLHVFGGWYTDPGCQTPYQFSSLISGDLELYAKWLGPDDERGIEYTCAGVILRDPMTQEVIQGSPKGEFLVEASLVNQSSIHAGTDVFILAVYGSQERLLSARLCLAPPSGTGENGVLISGYFSNPTGEGVTVKLFALSSLKGMIPLLQTTAYLFPAG